jgi:hypothetical protein
MTLGKFGGQRNGHPAEIYRLPADSKAADQREFQKIVDERTHPDGGTPYPPEVIIPLVVELSGAILLESGAETDDMPQRCPQIVGYRVAERLQFPVDIFQLGGPLCNPLLKLGVEQPDLFFGLDYRPKRQETQRGKYRNSEGKTQKGQKTGAPYEGLK